MRDFCGHGLGRLFHDSPEVVHAGRPGTGPELKPGMFFTIEPMINIGRADVKLLDDGWTAVTRDRSLSAQFEHSIGITETGCEIFTKSPKGLRQAALRLRRFSAALARCLIAAARSKDCKRPRVRAARKIVGVQGRDQPSAVPNFAFKRVALELAGLAHGVLVVSRTDKVGEADYACAVERVKAIIGHWKTDPVDAARPW